MKYKRGTVLRWTAKALNPAKDRLASDRMVVLDSTECLLYRGKKILASGMYKTHDSFVEPAGEDMPKGLTYDYNATQAPNEETPEEALATEFGYKLNWNLHGRKPGEKRKLLKSAGEYHDLLQRIAAALGTTAQGEALVRVAQRMGKKK